MLSKDIDAPIKGFTYFLPDVPPSDGVYILDTVDMFKALQGDASEGRKLEEMCRLLNIAPVKNLHNAGNDAHVRNFCFMFERSRLNEINVAVYTSRNEIDGVRERAR